MRSAVAVLTLVLATGITFGQAVFDLSQDLLRSPVEWSVQFGGSGTDDARSIRQTSDGGYIVAGYTTSFGGGTDAFVVRLSAAGKIIWQNRYGGSGYDGATGVAQTNDGGFIVVGQTFSFGAGQDDAWVLRLDANGGVVWQKAFGGIKSDWATAVTVAADGNYVVAGWTASFLPTNNSGSYVIKLADTGSVLWQKVFYRSNHTDVVSSISNTSDGGFILAGYSDGFQAHVLKLTSSGTLGWSRRIGPLNFDDEARDAVQAPDGGFLFLARTDSEYLNLKTSDLYYGKLSSVGNFEWAKRINREEGDYPAGIVDTGSGYVLAGTFALWYGNADGGLIKVDYSGNTTQSCSQLQDVTPSPPINFLTEATPASTVTTTSVTATATTATLTEVAPTLVDECGGRTSWIRSFGTTLNDWLLMIRPTIDGGFVTVGRRDITFNDVEVLVTKFKGRGPEVTVTGPDAGDLLGANYSVSRGDFNRDGIPDLLLGSLNGDGPLNARTDAGEAYLVFGPLGVQDRDLAALGSAGTRIYGIAAGDHLGAAVAVGDLNGNGFDDAVIGSAYADPSGVTNAGVVAVYFDRTSWSSEYDMASSAPDVLVAGVETLGNLGFSVATGDVNGDGTKDLLVGAPGVTSDTGRAYVFYGPLSPGTLLASSANVIVLGRDVGDDLGIQVATGNVNGTGPSDVILSAHLADGVGNGKSSAGEVYVIFGGSLPSTVNLALTSANVEVVGQDAGDEAGFGIAAGDVNNDGTADLVIGARKADGPSNGRTDCGEAYVVFGKSTLAGVIDLAVTSPSVKVYGQDAGDGLGVGVAVGNVNQRDGGDLIVGASAADGLSNLRSNAGEVDVQLGPLTPGSTFDLASVRPSIRLLGADAGDLLGYYVASGDANADGGDDVIAVALGGDGPNNTRSGAGEVYVFAGFCTPGSASICTLNNGACTDVQTEWDSSCACDACQLDTYSVQLFANGGTEGATCYANDAPCLGQSSCLGDTNGNFLEEGDYVMSTACVTSLTTSPTGKRLVLTARGTAACSGRKILAIRQGLFLCAF